jgi:hypothetical protein
MSLDFLRHVRPRRPAQRDISLIIAAIGPLVACCPRLPCSSLSCSQSRQPPVAVRAHGGCDRARPDYLARGRKRCRRDGAARTVLITRSEGCGAAAMLGRVLVQSGRAAAVCSALSPALPVCARLDPAVALAVVNSRAIRRSRLAGRRRHGPGGWAADKQIIQVRTRYVQTAFDRAAVAVPGAARHAFMTHLARLEAVNRLEGDPAPNRFMPSLAAWLQLSAVDTLATELRRTPTDASTFAARFASLWYARSFGGTILQHEGRHAGGWCSSPAARR